MNLVPGTAIWLLAGAVLLGWYQSDTVRDWMQALADFKQERDYLFAICSTALAGGIIPYLVRMGTGLDPRARQHLPWMTLFWATKGAEINALYQMQAWLFGHGNDAGTLAIKTAVDQLVYVPLWAIPSTAAYYAWVERGRAGLRHDLHDQWIARQVLPILLANWAVWIPTVCLIYALPLSLQLPLQNLALCLWSLLLAVIALREQGDRPAQPTQPHRI
ncbi:MAG: hypothetical protein ACOCXJ_03370 [Planctomycetota bacterium]